MPNAPRVFSLVLAVLLSCSAAAATHDSVFGDLSALFEKHPAPNDSGWAFSKKSRAYHAAIAPTHIDFVLTPRASTTPSLRQVDGPLVESRALAELAVGQKITARHTDTSAAFRLRFIGGSEQAVARGADKSPTVTHRIRGADKSAWMTNIPNFGSVRVSAVYPGIDIVYHSVDGDLRFDFEAAPGADTDRIKLAFEGADSVILNDDGALTIAIDGLKVTQGRPVVYQQRDNARTEVAGRYRQLSDTTFSFEVGAYDASRSLVIDPTVTYASYIGGSGTDNVNNVIRLNDGSLLVAGQTSVPDLSPSDVGAVPNIDVFVAKINASGTALDFVTYLGGTGAEDSYVLLEVANGEIVVGGLTGSDDFPLLSAFDTEFGSGFSQQEFTDGADGFVAKLSADGSTVMYSTYLGGNNSDPNGEFFGWEFLRNAELRTSDNAVVFVGETAAPDFPVTHALNGRTCMQDDVNEVGSVFTADTFVTIIGNAGELLASTCLGGSERDGGRDVTILPGSGDIAVAGVTRSVNFPVTAGAYQTVPTQSLTDGYYDGSVTVLSPDLMTVVSSTYLGGSSFDYNETITVNSQSQFVIGGITLSLDFPVTANAAQLQNGGVGTLPDAVSESNLAQDAYFVLMDTSLTTLAASTYYGGDYYEQMFVAELDQYDRIYFAGGTEATDLPVVNALQDSPGRVIGGPRTLVNASGVQGFDAAGISASVSDGTGGTITVALNAIARGGPGGATNLIQTFEDFNREQSLTLELGSAVADTRAIASEYFLLDASFSRAGVVTANCNDVSRLYEINSDLSATLVGSFGDPSFCAIGLALVDINSDELTDVIVHDGSTVRYYANSGNGVFTEDLSFPAVPVASVSALERFGGNGVLVGSYGGVDKFLIFSGSTPGWSEVILGNGAKNTTGFHQIAADGGAILALYDGSPIDKITSTGSGVVFDIATPVGRTDTNRTVAVTTDRVDTEAYYLYSLETTAGGDTLLSCYCSLSNDGTPLLTATETINLGATEYVYLGQNNSYDDMLFSLTETSAEFERRMFSRRDAYFAVLAPDLSRFDYSSYLGGPGDDYTGWGLTVDDSGVVTVSGRYGSGSLPGVSAQTSADSLFEGNQEGFVVTVDLRDVLDLDNDGIADAGDNCLVVKNIDQTDTDADGFGNACDGDFNQDNVSNFIDLSMFSANFLLVGDLVTDMNGDGVTNFVDFALFADTFLNPPGPSGLE